jgi:hypothetical protein
VAESQQAPLGIPEDIAAIRKEIQKFLDGTTADGRKIGNAKFGVYAFYDYDSEPIYVGQTNEMLRTRIRRHLTNQRTDAVAMNVLDPFEVAEIEVWPLWEFQNVQTKDTQAKGVLNAAEYTVFQLVLSASGFKAVLNEKDISPVAEIELPKSYRAKIIPDDLYWQRKHPDVRIARRATTIANLARVISERDVSKGLRRTLTTQARRLERLACERYNAIGGKVPIVEPGEEV